MAEKMKTIRPINKHYTLYPDETEDRIAELEREVANLQKKLMKHKKEDEGKVDIDELQSLTSLQLENDRLECHLRKQKRNNTIIQEEADLLRTEVEMLTKALNSPPLKEENLVEMMMQQLESRTDELHMSRTLIMELQNVAFSEYAEDKIVAQAKSVLYDNNHLKKKVMDMELQLLKGERKTNEIVKHSDLVDIVHERQTDFIRALKKKIKDLSKDKEVALEQVDREFEQKESKRQAQQKFKFDLLNVHISDLKSRLHQAEVSSGRISLPPLGPQGTDALLISEMRSELEVKSELVSDLKMQLNDMGMRGDKSSSSVKHRRFMKLKQAELSNKNKELEGEVQILREQLKLMTTSTTEEINCLREQKKRLANLLQNMEAMEPHNLNILKKEMETQTQYFEKKLEQKEKGVEKLHLSLRALTKDLSENIDPKIVAELSTKNRELIQENNRIIKDYQAEVVKRKKYYNLLEDCKGKIRVYVRVRPLTAGKEKSGESCVAFPDEFSLRLSLPNRQKDYIFDRVFQPEESQAAVFQEVSNLIQSAVDGYCVSIFAYGQTGSGKTYTLLGEKQSDRQGIAPRSFMKLFEIFEQQKEQFDFAASVSMVELYNDKLLDLLREDDPKNRDASLPMLDIKKDVKNMVHVQGTVIKDVKSAKELLLLYQQGLSCRHISNTKMNAHSSRSHLVISIVIESVNLASRQIAKGKFSIIDLAGSERVSKSSASNQTVKEANSINLSLSALGDVISALTSEQSYVPYRNSKLTMLMQDSLGGSAKTLMFLNISAAEQNSNETLYSLSYGARVKLIRNNPTKTTEAEKLIQLQNEILELKRRLGESNDQLMKVMLER